MSDLANQVAEPILNSGFAEPQWYWYLQEGHPPEKRQGRRKSLVFQPNEQRVEWDLRDGTLARSTEYGGGYELVLVNRIRERVKQWRENGYPGVTRVTLDLLKHWRREGRREPLFFAQLEAAETIIFLLEAPLDLRQGITLPRDLGHSEKDSKGGDGFLRYASKLATGTGKTTVMAMLAAWSILNKVVNRNDKRFSDTVLVVCPNVTIRNRLQELDPERGDTSLYRTRDLVPAGESMALLAQGKVIVTNWHVFEPQAPSVNGERGRVLKVGVPVITTETITIGLKNDTARGRRFLTEQTLATQIAQGLLEIVSEDKDSSGRRTIKARVTRYIESDAKLLRRVLGSDAAKKSNILVLNDEAHHAYRVKTALPDDWDTRAEDEQQAWFDEQDEATVWVEGLDRVNWNSGRGHGINFCVDLSATPYFLGRIGQETNRPFPWTVSDFGLMDAIESGLVKIPQLAVRDTTGKPVAGYFNIWQYVMEKLTPGERGGKRAQPRPAAILKYAALPIQQLAGLWKEEAARWKEEGEQRWPVFIVVCKNIKIATTIYDWLAHDIRPDNIGSAGIEEFRNDPERGENFTIRVDTKVAFETDSENAKNDEHLWMRFTLDSVGKLEWPKDAAGRVVYPEGFEALAEKLGRPKHPPGRDVRCIVSVAMLTEGWDCTTVTHVIGLRPFQSQLLCEQVVGRALRRRHYDEGENDRFSEELAKIFGVPFEVVPFKESGAPPPKPKDRKHVFALPDRANLEIRFPRVLRYEQVIRRVVAVDWKNMAPTELDPQSIPAEVDIQGLAINNEGKMRFGPGFRIDTVDLEAERRRYPLQRVEFAFASHLTKVLIEENRCSIPAQRLFPQVLAIVRRYIARYVKAKRPFQPVDVWHSPFYGLALSRMREAIRGDVDEGESGEEPVFDPGREVGSTAEVDFWTSKEVREVVRSHLNYVVADTKQWEQSAAYYLDKAKAVQSFVKNSYDPLGTRSVLGFTIPYRLDDDTHEYVPDFIAQLNSDCNLKLILESKGFPDPRKADKAQAAKRWVEAVNLDGRHGEWAYAVANHPSEVPGIIEEQIKQWKEPMPGIRRSADVCGGEACVDDTRIPVWVLEQGRRLGLSDEELLRNYPSITQENLADAWNYVREHRAGIDRDIRANEDELRE